VDRSVAQGRAANPARTGDRGAWTSERWWSVATGVALAAVALSIYLGTRTERFYDHFVWQAAAFLEGHAAIRYPVPTTAEGLGNWFFQDVLPVMGSDGVSRGLLPFPPLPALVLLPWVAMDGPRADDQTVFTTLAAIDVAICWWMLGGLRLAAPVRLGTTILFAFGTVFWYTAQLATTWYQAHILAVGLAMLAVGLAIRADPRAAEDEPPRGPRPAPVGAPAAGSASVLRRRLAVDPRGFAIGLLLGLAATARLPVILGAPLFLLVGPGGSAWRRGWSAGLGAGIPVALLLAYNVASTGHLFHPAYEYLYRLETAAYPALGYRADWGVEDPRYLPGNATLMFLTGPDVLPDRLPDSLGFNDTPVCTEPGAERRLFDPTCPLAVPRDVGMSVLLTSPALLLLAPTLRRVGRGRLVTGAVLAVVPIVLLNLMHFSQGWVQFGYRFSNDAIPFVLPLVALGFGALVERGRRWAMPLGMALIVVSIAINAWGVAWGNLLGW
jgi:hypothetical protein